MTRTSIATDNFNRAGPALGSNWTQLNTFGATAMTIGASTVLIGGGGGGASLNNQAVIRWAGAGSFTDDQYAKATILTQDFQSTFYEAGVVLRASADVNAAGTEMDMYAALVYQDNSSGNSHTCALVKMANGVQTTLGATVGIAWTDGDIVEAEVSGQATTTLTFFKNGVSQFSRTDSSSPLLTGVPGIVLSGSGITTRIDDWEAGNLSSGAVIAPLAMSAHRRMRQ